MVSATGKRMVKAKGQSLIKRVCEVPLSRLHEEFKAHKKAEGVRCTTLRAYEYDLNSWSKWCETKGVTRVDQVTTPLVEEFIGAEISRGLSTSSVRNKALAIRGTLKLAHKRGYIASERLYGYKLPRLVVASVYMPDIREVRIIFNAIEEHWSVARNPKSRFRNQTARTFFSRRDIAICGIQTSTGLRIGETFRLEQEDYNVEGRYLMVKTSKTGTPRAVPVSDHLAELLAAYLRVRPVNSPSNYLFVTEFGSQLHRDSWGHQFQRYLDFARSQGRALPRITLHSLRHLAATSMAQKSLHHASLLLGHSSSRVTAQRYVHVSLEAIRATHAENDPLAQVLVRTARPKREKLV